MYDDVIMAGFGGQGLLLIGKLLALACMEDGKEVAWIPSYGPEMRGGTANCTVVVSDLPIGSPIIQNPLSVVAMNLPSLDKFGPMVMKNGLLIINSSLIPGKSGRNDLEEIKIPANDIAINAGSGRAANMAALGAYVAKRKLVGIDLIEKQIKHQFEDKPEIIEINLKALHVGFKTAASKKVKK